MNVTRIQVAALFLELVNLINKTNGSMDTKHTLKIASELSPPFLMRMTENGRSNMYQGFVKDFCEELINIMGFYRYEIVLPRENIANATLGYPDGVLGMLVRNEADLAFGNTEVTMEHSQVVDFSAPVLTSRFSILYRLRNDSYYQLGTAEPSTLWAMFRPFPPTVWIPFIVVGIMYFGFIKFHNNMLYYTSSNGLSKGNPKPKLTYSKTISKTCLAIWLLFLFSSYISNYSAQKMLKATIGMNRRPETLADIISQKDVKIGWLAHGPVEHFFRNTVNEVYQRVYMQNVGRDWLSSDEEGVTKVLNENGNFAFIMDSLKADAKAQVDCSLYKLSHEFGPTRTIAVASSIGSPIRERINQAVLSLSEQGTLEALQNRWLKNPYSSQSQCTSPTTSANEAGPNKGASPIHIYTIFTQASLEEMTPIFVFSISGLLIAVIAGLLETIFLNRKFQSPQPKPPRRQQQIELIPKFTLQTAE